MKKFPVKPTVASGVRSGQKEEEGASQQTRCRNFETDFRRMKISTQVLISLWKLPQCEELTAHSSSESSALHYFRATARRKGKTKCKGRRIPHSRGCGAAGSVSMHDLQYHFGGRSR